MNTKKAFLFALLGLTVLAAGCRYDMQDQPRGKYYRGIEFFGNEMYMRPLIEGTVPRGYLRADKALYTGKKDTATISQETLSSEGGRNAATRGQTPENTGSAANAQTSANAAAMSADLVTEFPLPVTKELIDRGEDRYRIFCIVCHGPNGEGNGMVVRRGYMKPPSFYEQRLRDAPVGHFFDVDTNGFGRMNGYAAQIPVADRWAIVAYIRALQAANPNIAPSSSAPTPAASPGTRAGVNEQKNGGEN